MADDTVPQGAHADGCLTETTWDENDCNCRWARAVRGVADDTRPKGFDLLRGSSDVPDPIISGGPTDDTVRLTEQERESLFVAGVHTFGCQHLDHARDGARQDTITAAVEAILTARLSAVEAQRDAANEHAIECERIGMEAIEARLLVEAERDRLRETVARVEALVSAAEHMSNTSLSRTFDGSPFPATVSTDRLRAALDGPQ